MVKWCASVLHQVNVHEKIMLNSINIKKINHEERTTSRPTYQPTMSPLVQYNRLIAFISNVSQHRTLEINLIHCSCCYYFPFVLLVLVSIHFLHNSIRTIATSVEWSANGKGTSHSKHMCISLYFTICMYFLNALFMHA